jgi:hypothetical protein
MGNSNLVGDSGTSSDSLVPPRVKMKQSRNMDRHTPFHFARDDRNSKSSSSTIIITLSTSGQKRYDDDMSLQDLKSIISTSTPISGIILINSIEKKLPWTSNMHGSLRTSHVMSETISDLLSTHDS